MKYGYDVMPCVNPALSSYVDEGNRMQFPTYKEAKSYADELAEKGNHKCIEITRFVPFGRAHLQSWSSHKGWEKAQWEKIKKLGY